MKITNAVLRQLIGTIETRACNADNLVGLTCQEADMIAKALDELLRRREAEEELLTRVEIIRRALADFELEVATYESEEASCAKTGQ